MYIISLNVSIKLLLGINYYNTSKSQKYYAESKQPEARMYGSVYRQF